MAGLHVILGTGPVGCWTAHYLLEQGLAVRAVNRSGQRPPMMPAQVDVVAADVSDPSQAIGAARGADVVHQAMNPPYHRWPELFPALQAGALAAAESTGARYLSIDNLYMYSRRTHPIRPDSPQQPTTVKGRVRKTAGDQVLDAHRSGRVESVIIRSADYFGPGVTDSSFGARAIAPLLRGKRPSMIGALDQPHSYAYIEDVGRTAAALATQDAAFGQVWFTPHAPAVTQGELVARAAVIAGVHARPATMGAGMLRIGGLFIPAAREAIEMLYEFTEPFEVDSSATEQAFGLSATPLDQALGATIAWYRAQAQ
jgi:nucleoside-diphosphate-sugar epimerase